MKSYDKRLSKHCHSRVSDIDSDSGQIRRGAVRRTKLPSSVVAKNKEKGGLLALLSKRKREM